MIILNRIALGGGPPSPLGNCSHGLVEAGQVCPECVWQLAARGASDNTGAAVRRRRELLAIMLEACRRMVSADMDDALSLEAERGLWYALRFVRRWKAQQIERAA